MTIRCDDCPLKQFTELNDIDCVSKRHAKFCEHATSNTSYHPLIVQRSIELHNRENQATLEPPSLFAKIYNVGKAAFNAGANALRGNVTYVPDDIKTARIAKCESCPSNLYDKEKDICAHERCGCRIKEGIAPGVPPKTAVATEVCPEGHWDAYIVARSDAPKKSGCGCGG
jgi:hypothetical protein